MRKKRAITQASKRIYHPEIRQCLTCGTRLKRVVTIAERTVITLSEVIRVVHCGYRCPVETCSGHSQLYRSSGADALALPGFTFGLEVVLFVGHLRLRKHQTVDEIHTRVSEKLAVFGQTISRREMLVLFEAYAALVRAASEVQTDEAWKQQVRDHGGLLLSIDGIQPDKSNETVYLVRDTFTGRILNAENVTESTKDRLKQLLMPVVALDLPVVGVISDAQSTELQAVAELWPGVPHQICQFHAIREAGRLVYTLDQHTKIALRVRMQQKTHEFRQNIHKRIHQAEQQEEVNDQELHQFQILEEYAALVEGTLHSESRSPFQYGGLNMQEGLLALEASLKQLDQGGLV